MKLNRRDLLNATLGSLGLGCSAAQPEVDTTEPQPGEPRSSEPRSSELPAPVATARTRSSLASALGLVGVAHGLEPGPTLLRATAHAGGLPSVARGGTVLIKVNTNSGDPYPYSSSPRTVAQLARHYLELGAHVIVGDRSFWGDRNTRGNFESNGLAAACESAGAELRVFDEKEPWHELPALTQWVGPVRVPRLLMEADVVINLACAKTHFISGATLGLKNVLGVIHAEDRARPGNLRSHDADKLHHQVAEIHSALRPMFTIIDAFDALVAGGPTPQSGRTPKIARTGIVIAGADVIAVDAVGIGLLRREAESEEAVMRHPTWQSPILRAAIARDLGISGPQQLVWQADPELEALEALARES
jgi:uncharacterized protein (DUF362 family)